MLIKKYLILSFIVLVVFILGCIKQPTLKILYNLERDSINSGEKTELTVWLEKNTYNYTINPKIILKPEVPNVKIFFNEEEKYEIQFGEIQPGARSKDLIFTIWGTTERTEETVTIDLEVFVNENNVATEKVRIEIVKG